MNYKLPFWSEPRTLSRFEAWLSLLVLSSPDGRLNISVRRLAEQWQWTVSRTHSFLRELDSKGLVRKETSHETQSTIITVCNYGSYKNIAPFCEHRTKPKTEKPKSDKPKPDADITARAHAFGLSLVPYIQQYGKEMIRHFYDYWTEATPSKKKMRFEQQKTWETSRRLAYWYRNENSNIINRNLSNDNAKEQQRQISVADLIRRKLDESQLGEDV